MSSSTTPVIGIIGGSGLYDFEELEKTEWRKVESPFGEPSDELLFGEFDGSNWSSCRATTAATRSSPPS